MNIFLGQMWIRNAGIPVLFEYKLIQAENQQQAQEKMDVYARNKMSFFLTTESLKSVELELVTVQPPL